MKSGLRLDGQLNLEQAIPEFARDVQLMPLRIIRDAIQYLIRILRIELCERLECRAIQGAHDSTRVWINTVNGCLEPHVGPDFAVDPLEFIDEAKGLIVSMCHTQASNRFKCPYVPEV